MADARRLSRILFEAREQIDMWADVIEARMNAPAVGTRNLVAEIDSYRAEQGWSPHGFGGEDQAGPDSGSDPQAVDRD